MKFIDNNFNDYPIDFPEADPEKNEENTKVEEEALYPTEFPTSKSIIKVIGVGGGGQNVVTEIYKSGLDNIDLMICNTDRQVLENNPINEKILLGDTGLGAGCNPEKGRDAALASKQQLEQSIGDNIEMVFVTACLGGGTGTGAAPVIAEMAKKKGKLVVGVVTIPPRSEGPEFMTRAMYGLNQLRKFVDSLLIIDNQKMYEVYEDLPYQKAFQKANDVLATAVKTISEIVTKQGYMNVDMNDVRWILGHSGMVTMGIGEAAGPDRAAMAVENAFKSPLLSDCNLQTSTGVLVNIICSEENFKMSEEKIALENISSYTGKPKKFKRGIVFDNSMGDKVSVIVIATGFDVLNLPNGDGHTIIIPNNPDGNSDPQPGKFTHTFEEPKKTGPDISDDNIPRKRIAGVRPALIVESDAETEERDRIPAYQRRSQSKSHNGGPANNSSTFSITDTLDGQAIIPNNRYLHQTQD